MTEQPGGAPEPGATPEERLPATRPPSTPVPVDRFSAPPSAHRNDLTPERAAGIVRQSASARWVGLIAVIIVALFVIGYYFYELGVPGGLTKARLTTALEAQQVLAVERGYNIYQANCAQCHGVDGEGGKGPILNDQVKLFAHLSPEYIHNMLEAGGRYACGDPNSAMPVWSNTGSPPGPLNYKQVEDVIAFIRAEQGREYRVMNPELFEPVIDPETGEEETFEGWVDPNYVPAPGSTPFPDCWSDQYKTAASAAPAGSPDASDAPDASGSLAPQGTVLTESALNSVFEVGALTAPADEAFQIVFENKDAGILHNIAIKDSGGTEWFAGAYVTGVATTSYNVQALPAGSYTFVCTVHPNMTGTLTVGN